MTYLVLARCGMDDIPMGIFDDIKQAKNLAAILVEADVKRIAREVFKYDVSIIYSIAIVTFNGPIPFECEIVRDLEDDVNF